MPTKRRLPVIASGPADDEPSRPRWQWVVFGALAIVVVWLPLAATAAALSARVAVLAALSLAALACASFAGGFLVGKWGGSSAGAREAAWAGLSAGAAAVLGSALTFGFAAGSLLVVAVSWSVAALGGRIGMRHR